MPTFATANLTGHFDASVTTGLWKETAMSTHPANGEGVRAWDDVGDAIGYALFSLSGASAPAYLSSGIGALSALQFDGAASAMRGYLDNFTGSLAISQLIANNAYTVFVALQIDGDGGTKTNTYENPAVIGDDGGFFGLHHKTVTGQDKLLAYNWDGSDDAVSIDVARGVPLVAEFRHDSGNLRHSVNQGGVSSAASGNTSAITGQLLVGETLLGSGPKKFNGRIGEILFYNAALTGSDYSDTYQYLMDKWTGAALTRALGRPMGFFGVGG